MTVAHPTSRQRKGKKRVDSQLTLRGLMV